MTNLDTAPAPLPGGGRRGSRDRRYSARALFCGSFLIYAFGLVILLHVRDRYAPLVLMAASSGFVLLVVWLFQRCELGPRSTTAAIIGGSATLQAVALSAGPTTSDDVYRYIWDGKVQLSGIDPYAYAPQAPQLAHLRDGLLFGPTSTCAHPIPGGCTAINRPDVHTVYPPTAQALFDVVRIVSAGHGGVRPFQIAAALGVLAVAVLLLRHADQRGLARWPVALWAWSPLAVIEYGNNAHIDWSAALLGVACLLLAARGRTAWAAALLAAVTLTKLYPGLLLPSVIRRRPAIVLGTAAVVAALAYLPHVLAVGGQVIGYLPGYLQEEGYSSGSRSLLLGAVLPHPDDTVLAVALLAAAAWWCWRHTLPAAPEQSATILVGIAFLLATPTYGWYAGLLLALIIMSRRFEWLPVVLAPALVYLVRTEISHSAWLASLIYAIAAVAVVALWRIRFPHRNGAARISRG